MNSAQRQALETAIANAGDNLARARMQLKADPNWVSGNGETIQQVVTKYEQHYYELKSGLDT